MKVKLFSLTLKINGEIYQFHSFIIPTIKTIIRYFDYKENLIVIEHNTNISSSDTWNQTELNNNDSLEIITIVGGG